MILLYAGRSIITPVLVAAFLWYLTNAISAYYRKILPGREFASKITDSLRRNRFTARLSPITHYLYDMLAFGCAAATIGGLIWAFVVRIQPMFSQLIARLPEIQSRLNGLSDYISMHSGINVSAASLPDLTGVITGIGASVAGIAATTGLVLVYTLFMFIEQGSFPRKFVKIFNGRASRGRARVILDSITNNIKKYMFIKTFISGLTAILSYFVMLYFGLEFAAVWAFIIFILNYIPTFGSIIACGLPILYSLVSMDNLRGPVAIAIGLVGLQIVIGNILEPRLTGNKLNLSTLAILINLVFWGILWGPIGMFFSVPLLVATLIILSQFDNTRWIAVLLSANGEIPDVKVKV